MAFRLLYRTAAVGAAAVGGAGLFTAAYVTNMQEGAEEEVKNITFTNPSKENTRLPHPETNSVHYPVSMLDAIGNTPLIEITSLSKATGCRVLGKAEWMNPGGSVKDRPALYLVEHAEKSGALQPGGTIVEGTGGNTGIGLAMIAAAKGYKCIFTHPSSIAAEKINTMNMLGAVPITNPEHYFHIAQRIARERPNHVCVGQFENIASAQAHYETTGPEIWVQTGGDVDAFCCAAGTGGTMGGISRYLKKMNPTCIVHLVDPPGSALFGAVQKTTKEHTTVGTPTVVAGTALLLLDKPNGSSICEGVGIDRKTRNFAAALDHHAIDDAQIVTDDEVVDMAYHLLREDGIFVGPSAALNVVGAYKLAKQLGPGHTIVTILCDGGDRYKSKLYNAAWLKDRGLAPKPWPLGAENPSPQGSGYFSALMVTLFGK